MKNWLLAISLFVFTPIFIIAQDCEVNAGRDTFDCSLTWLLEGTPIGGTWTYQCLDTNRVVHLQKINASSAQATVARCGAYTFTYTYVGVDTFTLSDGNIFLDTFCVANDNITINLTASDVAVYNIKYEESVGYAPSEPFVDNIVCDTAIAPLLPPEPKSVYDFFFEGVCNSNVTVAHYDTVINCIADTIIFENVVTTGEFMDTIPACQDDFISVNEELGTVEDNNYFRQVFRMLDTLTFLNSDICPIANYCAPIVPEPCFEVVNIDTIQKIIPIRVGGFWTWFPEPGEQEALTDTVEFIQNDSIFELITLRGVRTYLNEFKVLQRNWEEELVPPEEIIEITLQWEEEWVYDTLPYYLVTVRDTCCDNGGIFYVLDIPSGVQPIPEYEAEPFTLTFIPPFQATSHIVSCNDTTYQVQIDLESGYPPYEVEGIPGSLDSNLFLSDILPIDTVLNVQVRDSVGCFRTLKIDVCPCVNIDIFAPNLIETTCFEPCTILEATAGSTINDSLQMGWQIGDMFLDTTIVEVCQIGIYNFIVKDTISQCKDTAEVEINYAFELPNASAFSTDILDCEQQSVTIDGSNSSISEEMKLEWFGPGLDSLNPDTTLFIEVEQPGSYQLFVSSGLNGCIDSFNVEVVLDTIAPIAALLQSPVAINCTGFARLVASNSQSQHPLEYIWVTEDTTTLRGAISTDLVGEHILIVRDTVSGCRDTIIGRVENFVPIDIELDVRNACQDSLSGRIVVERIQNGNPPYLITINEVFAGSQTVFGNLADGSYAIEVEDEDGCIATAAAAIRYFPPIELDLPDTFHICGPESIAFDLTQNNNYPQFTTYQVINDQPIFTLNQAGDYTAIITTPCELQQESFTIVDDLQLDEKLRFPNAFTPNNDDLNDTFQPYSELEFSDYELKVYNRWGQLVFQTRTVNEGWDGSYNGALSPSDVYIYYFRGVTDTCERTGEVMVRKGDVTLIR